MHGGCGEGEGDQIMKGVDFVKYDMCNGNRSKKPMHPCIHASIFISMCVYVCVRVCM